jgi:hypothetical protein
VGRSWGTIETAGESHHAAAIEHFFLSIGRTEGGVTTTEAVLLPEPTNPFDRHAVKVTVDGHHIGYVPADLSPKVSAELGRLPRGSIAIMPARVWGRLRPEQWYARVTLGYDIEPEPERDYYADERESREREARFKLTREAGSIDGDYWTVYKPEVAELKRQARYEDAFARLLQMSTAAEREAAISLTAPDDWPTDQICIVLAKLKRTPEVLGHLERYVAACGSHDVPDRIKARHTKAKVTASQQ